MLACWVGQGQDSEGARPPREEQALDLPVSAEGADCVDVPFALAGVVVVVAVAMPASEALLLLFVIL